MGRLPQAHKEEGGQGATRHRLAARRLAAITAFLTFLIRGQPGPLRARTPLHLAQQSRNAQYRFGQACAQSGSIKCNDAPASGAHECPRLALALPCSHGHQPSPTEAGRPIPGARDLRTVHADCHSGHTTAATLGRAFMVGSRGCPSEDPSQLTSTQGLKRTQDHRLLSFTQAARQATHPARLPWAALTSQAPAPTRQLRSQGQHPSNLPWLWATT